MSRTATPVLKVFTADQWTALIETGVFHGSADDLRDGFIHLSTDPQLAGTLARHFAGAVGLVVAEIATERFGSALRWEESRGGMLFPHLYATLETRDIVKFR